MRGAGFRALKCRFQGASVGFKFGYAELKVQGAERRFRFDFVELKVQVSGLATPSYRFRAKANIYAVFRLIHFLTTIIFIFF